jgi:hypothetical protein
MPTCSDRTTTEKNPNGISSSSEGLARSAYPGTTAVAQQPLGAGMLVNNTSISAASFLFFSDPWYKKFTPFPLRNGV